MKLQEITFIELSVEPIATRFELGWKDREIIGDLQNLSLDDAVQHEDYVL